MIMAPTRRAMVFIDGENLVARYQAMVTEGWCPGKEVIHEIDTYVWTRLTEMPDHHKILRATYYTYAQGDEDKVVKTCDSIRNMSFNTTTFPLERFCNLYPRVFKKSRNAKAKGVDIQMTVDILTHTYQNNLDLVYLLSGDGDYKPVIEECIRHGKVVHVGAFSSGLNKDLTLVADHFTCIDGSYFTTGPGNKP